MESRTSDEEISRAIELETCSLRLLVVHVGTSQADEHAMVLNVHHIATDGWSATLLTEDIVTAYNAHVSGEAVQLRSESTSLRYSDYAEWQHELLSDEALMEPHVQYWQETLGGELPVLELQTDHARPAVLTMNGAAVSLTVESETTRELGVLCKECGVTMMRGVLAA